MNPVEAQAILERAARAIGVDPNDPDKLPAVFATLYEAAKVRAALLLSDRAQAAPPESQE